MRSSMIGESGSPSPIVIPLVTFARPQKCSLRCTRCFDLKNLPHFFIDFSNNNPIGKFIKLFICTHFGLFPWTLKVCLPTITLCSIWLRNFRYDKNHYRLICGVRLNCASCRWIYMRNFSFNQTHTQRTLHSMPRGDSS